MISGCLGLRELRMKANPRDVNTGVYYIDGDVAAGHGALAA